MIANGLMRRMGQQVARYELAVNGTRAETHPLVLAEISVEHRLEGSGLDAAVVRQALSRNLQLSAVVVTVDRAAKFSPQSAPNNRRSRRPTDPARPRS